MSLRDNGSDDDLRPPLAVGISELPKIVPKSLETGGAVRAAEATVRTISPTELQYFQVTRSSFGLWARGSVVT